MFRSLGVLAAMVGLAFVAPAAAAERDLLITFADTPDVATATARLAGIATPRPVLPEAGVWSVSGAEGRRLRTRLAARPGVRSVEWERVRRSAVRVRVPALPLPSTVPTPTDPLHSGAGQWGLFRTHWTPAVIARTVRPRIAILDSGIDPTHEEWNGNGGPTPIYAPRSFVRDVDRWQDWAGAGHGTHVAGIAAAPLNGVGVVGVAPARGTTAQVIPVQIGDRLGRSTDADMIRGIRWAVRNGARVINISSGGPGALTAFQETIYWATERGAVIVASVGNEGTFAPGLVNYPAAYRRVIGVGALCDGNARTPDCGRDPTGVAAFSNRNRSVDLVAPGVNVLSSVPLRVRFRRVAPGYALKDGTSMSAPFVAGAAALVFANHPRLSAYQVRRQLANTAVDLGARGRDDRSGYGLVNPQAAAIYSAPPDDPHEVNDTLARAHPIVIAPGRSKRIEASADAFDDPTDVYRVRLARGDRIGLTLRYRRSWAQLRLWRPGVRRLSRGARAPGLLALGRRVPGGAGVQLRIVRRAPRTGYYYIDVAARRGVADYTLDIRRDR